MDMIPVDSEAIHSVGYDGKDLYVRWKSNGKTYRHPNVPRAKADALMAADSKGGYHATHIRAQFPGEPVG